MRALRITDWSRHFETCESKRITKLSWVAIPNSMEGRGYLRLTRHKSAVGTIAGWYAIVQIGSKMPHRGLLAKVDGPLSAADLSDISRLPEDMFTRAIEVLLEPEIGWLEWVNVKWLNGIPEVDEDSALPSAGPERSAPAYREDRQTDPKRDTGASRSGASPAWTERIQLAGGTVYGKGDKSWQGLVDDYGLEVVLRAMEAMKGKQDGIQAKAVSVRLWIGKNGKPAARLEPAADPAKGQREFQQRAKDFADANEAAQGPLALVDEYLVDPGALTRIQDAVTSSVLGKAALGHLREGKRTAMVLANLLKAAPELNAIAYPPKVRAG